MSNFFDQTVGLIGGGPAQVDAAGAGALITSKLYSFKNDLLSKAQDFGAKVGPSWGSDLFGALYKGSAAPAAAAVTAEQVKLFGFSTQTVYIAAGAFLLALVFVFGRKR